MLMSYSPTIVIIVIMDLIILLYLLLLLLPTTDDGEVEANLDTSLSVIPIKSNSSNTIKYSDTSSPRYPISLLSLSKSLSISSPSSPTTAIIIASAASLSVLVPTAPANGDTVAYLTNLPAHSDDDDDFDDPPIPLLYIPVPPRLGLPFSALY